MRRLPPLPAIRVFEAAARHENFTAAAAELGMTQAAVSYQIRLLEERLGLPLFQRSKQRVSLSDAGRKAAPVASAAFDMLADAFAALTSEEEGVLAISTAATFASVWLAPRLGTFQVAHSDLAVRLGAENRLVDFAADTVDAAVRIGRGPWPGLRHHFLFRSHGTPICTPDFRERHGLERPEQLLEVPRLSPDDLWWKNWLVEAGVPVSGDLPRAGVRLDNQVMEARAALAGHGIAMMTPYFWRRELETGQLVQPFPHLHYPGVCHWLVYPEHKRNQRKIGAFRDWLLAEVRASRADAPPEVFAEPVGIS